jgi:hypothetical protein
MKNKLLAIGLCISQFALAQTDSLPSFQFEDVDSTPVKRYASQKVLNLSPNRFISVGYEYQGGFSYNGGTQADVTAARGMRVGLYTPIVSTNKLILNLAGTYWRTSFPLVQKTFNSDPFINQLQAKGTTSFGINLTGFKPLNEKNFLIGFVSTDVNYIGNVSNIDKRALTVSATGIYGWKKGENLMWGLGVSRTYRMGRVLHLPVLLYNRTFNSQWGIEALLPARAHVRRNFNAKNILLAGYELEGNQHAIYGTNNNWYLQRGEIKTRLIYERSLYKFWWVSIQVGLRANGRFTVVNTYDGKEANEVIKPTLGNALYGNISLNLVSL